MSDVTDTGISNEPVIRRGRQLHPVPVIGALLVVAGITATAAWHIHEASRNIVFSDEWAFIPWLGKSLSGHTSLQVLWDQHNQTRDVLLRGLLFLSANFDHLNDQHLKYLGLAFALATFVSIAAYCMFIAPPRRRVLVAWILMPAAVVLLGLQQWEDFLVGINCVFFSTVTFGVIAIILFERALRVDRNSHYYVVGAIAMALLSTFSTSAGNMTWIVLVVQGFLPGKSINSRGKTMVLAFVGILVWFAYLWGFQGASSPLSLLNHPISSIGYFLATIGNSVLSSTGTQLHWQDVVVGALLLCVYLWCFVSYLRIRNPHNRTNERPLICLILLGLLYSLLLTSGRSGGGAPADASRYAALTVVAVVGAWAILSLRVVNHSVQSYSSFIQKSLIFSMTLVIIGICMGISTEMELALTSSRAGYFEQLASVLISTTSPTNSQLQLFEWQPSEIRQSIPILKRFHLNIYATSHS